MLLFSKPPWLCEPSDATRCAIVPLRARVLPRLFSELELAQLDAAAHGRRAPSPSTTTCGGGAPAASHRDATPRTERASQSGAGRGGSLRR